MTTKFIFIYIIIALLIGIYRFIKNPTLKCLLVILPISILSSSIVGLRPLNAGFDTEVYVSYFNSIQGETLLTFNNAYSYNFSTEYLYKLWNLFISKFTSDAQVFLFVTSFFSVLLSIYSFKKLFGANYLLVFLFLFTTPGFTMLYGNGIRQGLAFPFFILAVYYFLNKKHLMALIFILITPLFHLYSGVFSIFTFVLYVLLNKFIIKKPLVTFIFLVFLQPLSSLLQNAIYSIYPSVYLEYGGNEYLFHYSFIIFLILFLLYNFKLKIKNPKIQNIFSIYTVMVATISIIWFAPTAYGRILYLSFPFMCFFILYLHSFIKEKITKPILIVLFLFIGIYFYNSNSVKRTMSSNFFISENNLYNDQYGHVSLFETKTKWNY